MVTDSAAASTAWALRHARVSTARSTCAARRDPKLRPDRPPGPQTPAAASGLVTTTRITHATPAGFATVQANRNDEHEISPQYLSVVDVLLGGGRKHFDAKLRGDDRNVIAEYEAAGYTHWHERSEVTGAVEPEQVLGLFYDEHMPYTIDHNNDAELARQVPTLAEMTRKALAILGRHSDGFLLQVEGGVWTTRRMPTMRRDSCGTSSRSTTRWRSPYGSPPAAMIRSSS
jgi:alkaline phosphatase